ncbi:NAD(P)-dependent alcohol dehydrogenase [Aquabacterium sp. A7-Y]|uniref:zinc-dependent alcohol dehydrogenase family protein n=1 Tax=Aquabacterium sp. A7-Y TaxID=1349605 RepID=UPI00223D2B29|nr:NAD(P)-dependent alcohol dehydrogenase [Aquabacterium sp. A7-Y]MCW7539360.1 NAD(P)-dependent alcohol dehydrogenase [Aquabacterium sp. A7-Y]
MAYQFRPGKGLASLEVTTLPSRALRPHEVRVAVRAVSLNYRDILIYRGEYPAPSDRAVIPCSDGAGTVVEAGSEAGRSLAVGDEVVGSFFPHWRDGAPSREGIAVSAGCNVDGWLAEEVVVDSRFLVRLPRGMAHATAACAPCAGVTAWVAMFESAQLKPGAWMLVQGTGGVAMWAARLAEARGIKTVVIGSDPTKAALMQPAGRTFVNYLDRPTWSEDVLQLTQGHGADLVLELGGKSTIRESLRALAFGGHVAVIGGLGGWTYDSMEYLQLITKMATAHGIYVGSARSLADLLAFVDEHHVEPHISARFSFRDAPAAFEALEAGRHVGKLVIELA